MQPSANPWRGEPSTCLSHDEGSHSLTLTHIGTQTFAWNGSGGGVWIHLELNSQLPLFRMQLKYSS